MIVIDNSNYEAVLSNMENNTDNIRIELSADVFLKARQLIQNHENLIVADNYGKDLCVLSEYNTFYFHSYAYTGELDMWFLDQYETLILRGCNEYSVELVITALKLWKGKKVVFVGKDWGYLIKLLPEIDGKECIWEDYLSDEDVAEHCVGEKYLDVRVGIPHEEPMDRYYKNIMTYDEVMIFTFLFAYRRELGSKNPEKRFYLIDALYGQLGLFTIYNKAVSLARYVKKKGFIPVFRIKNEFGEVGIYQDYEEEEIWEKFFNQPEIYSIEDLEESKNVYYSPILYNASILQNIMNNYSHDIELSWLNGIYNDSICDYLREKGKQFLPFPNKTLGVLARGTDYLGTSSQNHAIHASKEMVGNKIDELLSEWELEYIFVATEDEDYYNYFKERFGDKVSLTDQERYRTKQGEWLAEMQRTNSNKPSGWKMGADYILAIYLLSKCNSFIASGRCSGEAEAGKMNNGLWKNSFVFEMGRNM